MNRFSDASLYREASLKPIEKMKKYITPNTEAIEAIYGSVICHSNDGQGSQDPPGTPSGPPLGAPAHVF